MDPVIHTFGCKVNSYDSGLIEKWMRESPDKSHSFENVHIINTCAVTQNATKEAVRSIRKIKSKNPLATVVVTGCAAQVDTDAFNQLSGADLVVANSHKAELPQILNKFFKGVLKERVIKSNIFKKEDLEMGGGVNSLHTRSFLKIQDGCNSFCSYCIIPYARGKSRSVPALQLQRKIEELEKKGVREVVLTGIHMGDYQDPSLKKDSALPSARYELTQLVEYLLVNTQNIRFRLSSLEPQEVEESLLDLFSDERLCPHLHLSIQSADDHVLKNMKRTYTQADILKSFDLIHRKIQNPFIGMDVIVGFPTETSEQFNNTYEFLKGQSWSKIHVFPYSLRSGTKATLFENLVSPMEKSRRAKALRDLSLEKYEQQAHLQKGLIKKALILKNKGRGVEVLSQDYWPLKILDAESYLNHWRGEVVPVKVIGYNKNMNPLNEGHLVAEVSV